MSEQASFALRGRNPDVLTCIANLSNDEVFTPPEFANRMLDTLAEAWAERNSGANIWADSSVRFLDPFTKSGVFLREISTRLIDGLQGELPDLQERVDHILTKQIFGIGITRLTSLLARRSLYCSKHADGEHSVATSFDDTDGNIWFKRIEHSWAGSSKWVSVKDRQGNTVKKFAEAKDRKCEFCGAPRAVFDRAPHLDNHAYAFIHTSDIKSRIAEIFGADMQFDVIIGNPPYQIEADEAGQNILPIYNLFVEQAKRLEPRFISMIIPSRWMAGGKYLDEFRSSMLNDDHLSVLIDYHNAADVFSSVGINGGVGYFLWDSSHSGDCAVTTVRGGQETGPYHRNLHEFDVFIRDIRAVSILRKVLAFGETPFSDIVSPRDPFGPTLSSNFKDFSTDPKPNSLQLHYNQGTKRATAWVEGKYVTKSLHLVDAWKVLIPKAGSGREREKSGVDLVLGPPLIAEPNSVCTLTYVVVGPLASKKDAESVYSYLRTRFVRFLISLRKISQDAPRGVYTFVPQQSWGEDWTDEMLYEKYGISEEESEFIETMIRPMRAVDD